MKNQTIMIKKPEKIFKTQFTVVNANRLIQMLPDIQLDCYANEIIVKRQKTHIEIIPFDD